MNKENKRESWKKQIDDIFDLAEKEEQVPFEAHGLKLFISALLAHSRQETERAFGDCKKCYGKGYSTQLENWSGHGECDIGQGDVHVFESAPYYLPCSCDRGKQIKEFAKDTRHSLIDEITEKIKTIDTSGGGNGRRVVEQILQVLKEKK